ncbi:MAG: hypothetical protein INR71_01540 [Terriglobus roseus]|nr:hypothetical protein [Terriglobus roseus]
MEFEERLDSDISSIVSTSSRPMASDSEAGEDFQKYRLPEPPKTRAHPRSIPLPVRTVSYTLPSSGEDTPPPPPPKDDEPPSAVSSTYDPSIAFNPYGLSRTNSIYTLSRVSFNNQISQLTSIKLPDASSLAASIDAIPTAHVAVRALNEAAEQIRRWIRKASEVLNGLDAEDDVEWAAAGRESLEDVNTAVTRFDELIQIYLTAIERVQARPDIANLQPQDLEVLVDRMESITNDWNGSSGIKKTLKDTKTQVDMALEWEELWNIVLGEIGVELEALERYVFEMEERRHRSISVDVLGEGGNKLDIKELETIVEEAPGRAQAKNGASNPESHRFSVAAFPPNHAAEAARNGAQGEDATLIQLAARMQPLRASLDFLPMRLAPFILKADKTFPTACGDLERRRKQLEEKYQKLDQDAEALRRELGEDQWVLVFRNAGRQMLKMCESVGRTMEKLRDSLEDGEQHTNPPAMFTKIQTYESKKMHYGQAIERVLNVIDTGVRDRLTVNGEILTLQKEMRQRWSELQAEMKAMDFVLVELNINKNNLRDSISTILSMDRASAVSSTLDTPGSSPASSVVLTSRKSSEYGTPGFRAKSRQGSFASSTRTQIHASAGNRRHSSLPVAKNYGRDYTSPYSQKAIAAQRSISSSISEDRSTSSLSSSRFGTSSVTPTQGRRTPVRTPNSADASKPRWNSSTNMRDTVVGHNFRAASSGTPSQYRKEPSPSNGTVKPHLRPPRSALPMPSPLGRPQSRSGASSAASDRPASRLSIAAASAALAGPKAPPARSEAPKTPATTRLAAPRVRPAAGGAGPPRSAATTVRAKGRASSGAAAAVPATPSVDADDADAEAGDESPSVRGGKAARPASVMAGRRSSMLPVRRGPSGGSAGEASRR